MTLDLTATGEVTWREVPEVQKAVWTAAAAFWRDPALSETTKLFRMSWLLTWALAVKGDAFITCLHMLRLCLYGSSWCIFYFHVNAQLHLRIQGSRKVKRSASGISRLHIFPLRSSYHHFEQIHNGIALLYSTSDTWTKQLTILYFNKNTFLTSLSS